MKRRVLVIPEFSVASPLLVLVRAAPHHVSVATRDQVQRTFSSGSCIRFIKKMFSHVLRSIFDRQGVEQILEMCDIDSAAPSGFDHLIWNDRAERR